MNKLDKKFVEVRGTEKFERRKSVEKPEIQQNV